MNRDRPVLRGLMAAGLSWMVLLVAITVGMRIPPQESLSGFDSDGELDYSAYLTGFAPLSLGFISEVLGLEDSPAAVADGSDESLDAAAASGGTSSAADMAAPARTEVEHPFTNDDAASAYEVESLPFRARTDTSDGTRSSDEPNDCFLAGGTAWYRYRPKTDVALFSDTFGTSRPTALGVYAGTESGGFELIGCDQNALGNAQVGFPAEAGTAYYFQVTSMARGGPTIFGLAAVGGTTVVSDAPSGAPADGPAFDRADISADGRYIVFTSFARNLTSSPPDCGTRVYCKSVYLRDRVTQQTELISSHGTTSSPAGESALEYSTLFPSLSADGRYVGFSAYPGPWQDVLGGSPGEQETAVLDNNSYLYDRVTQRVMLVSRNSSGEPARHVRTATDPWANSLGPSVSSDGRYVVFNSNADNMPGQSDPPQFNVYRRDLVTGKTRLVSTTPWGDPNHSYNCAATGRNVSGDGRYAVFYSTYGGGYHFDGTPRTLVYLWDARTGKSRLVSKVIPAEEVIPGEEGQSSPAEPDHTATLNRANPKFTWESSGSGVPDPSFGLAPLRCTGGPFTCEYILLDVEKAGELTLTLDGTDSDPTDEVQSVKDIDGRLYRSNAAGEPVGQTLTNGCVTGSYSETCKVGVGPGFYVVEVEYFLALEAHYTGTVELAPAPGQATATGAEVLGSYCPSISLDGSRVGLVSRDPLVPEDTNGLPDVYVYDVATERIKRISVTSAGEQTHDPNFEGREYGFLKRSVNLSADGRFAVFDSSAPDLAPSAVGSIRHPPETTRVFVHDMLTGATVLASVSSTGEPLGGDSHMPYISADGSAVVFMNTPVGGVDRVMVHELSFFR